MSTEGRRTMFGDNIPYEQMWIAFAVLCVINLLLFFCIGMLMRRVGKLEDRTAPLTSYSEFDYLMQEYHMDRVMAERAWREEQGIGRTPPPIPEEVPRQRPGAPIGVDEDPLQQLRRIMEHKDPTLG